MEATLYGRGSCGVVLVPQINLDRESWHPQAERLASEGLVALPIDEGSDRVPAVLAAVEYLRTEHSISHVVLMGASTGGEAAVVAAATKPDRVDGVITLSAAGGVVRANRLTGAQLFVVSRGDEQEFVDMACELNDRAPEPKHLEIYDGGAHGQRLFESPHRQDLWTNVLTTITNVCQN
ncbi:alpha/beta hydrolase family protein [Halorientalis salina]|uniref:alpha/beta hydrolase family protein n=1 Tax=Halorientalis salina TaxID=2932266 RepID=UPI0010AB94DD|nr:alpha/beta hydrolase [Halorientalis salina]